MKTLGGFPVHDGRSWNSSHFSKSEIFEKYPEIAFDFYSVGFGISKPAPNANQYIVVSRPVALLLPIVSVIIYFQFTADLRYSEYSLSRNAPIHMKTVEEFGVKNLTTAESDIAAIRNFLSAYVRTDFYSCYKIQEILSIAGSQYLTHEQ